MVQVDLITGFLGAGKTTFLRRYAAWWAGQGVKVCVLENDFGAVNVDDQDVSSAQINIPIVFQHACTQVVVEVSAGDGIQLSRLLSATITPPVPGASMTLSTGVIPPATSYDKPDKMGINGFLAQYIMLPLQTNDPMTLTLEVETDGNNNSKTYSVQIPVPSGELKAGDSYLFSAVINGSSVSIPSVSVKDWTEVDETGNPLYPSQK